MKSTVKFFTAVVALSMAFVSTPSAQVGMFTGGGDIGGPGLPGSASVDGDVYTLEASGADIWADADQMHYIWFEASGAFSFKVDDIILNVGGGDSSWAKAGLMVRDNDTPGSPNGFSMIHGVDNSFRPQFRASQDGSSSGRNPDVEFFNFFGKIEIERIGNQINFIYTDDFTGERILHSSANVELTDPVLVGLALTSHENAGTSTASFTNPQFTQYDSAFLVSRSAPVKFPDGGTLQGVVVTLEVVEGTPDVTVTETAPEGWSVSNIQTSVGTANASGNVITWNVSAASGQPTLTYDTTPPAGTEMGEWGESTATDGTLNAITVGSSVAFKDQFPNDFSRLLEEDFESVPLGPFVDESNQGPEVWTMTPPDGWSVDSSGVVGFNEGIGVTEWRGWSFTDKDAWNAVAGDQRRSEYTLGQGVVAVADPDEWDDCCGGSSGSPDDEGDYATFISTPVIDIPAGSTQIAIAFDSSWRPEDIQEASLDITFDGSNTQNVMFWDSTPSSANFKDDNSTNEPLLFLVDVPAGAQNFFLNFGMPAADNDWWWAIDNVVVGTDAEPADVQDWSVY